MRDTISAVERAVLAATDLLPRGSAVMVACSGGADSVALAAAMARRAGELGIRAALGHVDHGLRPESGQEARQVSALAERLALPFHCERLSSIDVRRAGLEASARDARYAALGRLAREAIASRVATAHTRRDQAETVLLRLARGGGPGAFAGIRRSRQLQDGVLLIRPLLEVSREDTEAYCAALGLPALRDPHNADPRRARARLRELFPLLAEALNPRLEEALAGAARVAADEDALLDGQARAALEAARTPDGFRASALAALPKALGRRALLAAARGVAQPERAHLEQILEALRRDDARFDVPGGRAVLEGGLLRFEPHSAELEEVSVSGPGSYRWAGRLLEVGRGGQAVDLRRAPLPWTLRGRRPGDRFQPEHGRERKVSDLWSEARIPRARRSRLALLADAQGRVFWVEGLREGAACAGPFEAAFHFGFGPEMDGLR